MNSQQRHPSPNLSVSVITPVHGREKVFHSCLSNLKNANPPPDEIIAVVDGGNPQLCDLAAKFGAKVFKTDLPQGPARARNLGARHARGDLIFFVDSDVTIQRNAIDQIIATFKHDPKLAALLGSYDDKPAASGFLSQYKNLLHHYVHQTANEKASTFWGACGVVKRDVFAALGGFDERYRQPSIEDIELGYRMTKAGYRIRLLKTLQVKHLKRWGVRSLLKTDFFQRALPWTKLILRDRNFVNDLNLKISSRISVIATYGLLMALAAAFWRAEFLFAALVFVALLLALNASLYLFFKRKRGYWFALRAIPWHWLYYFYSGLALAIGLIQHHLENPLKNNQK